MWNIILYSRLSNLTLKSLQPRIIFDPSFTLDMQFIRESRWSRVFFFSLVFKSRMKGWPFLGKMKRSFVPFGLCKVSTRLAVSIKTSLLVEARFQRMIFKSYGSLIASIWPPNPVIAMLASWFPDNPIQLRFLKPTFGKCLQLFRPVIEKRVRFLFLWYDLTKNQLWSL